MIPFYLTGNPKSYYVLSSTPECVALYVSSERIICAPFDRTSKEVEQKFTVINLSGKDDIVLSYEKIGPLHPKPTPTPTPLPTNTPTITPIPTETPLPTLTATP